MTKPPNRGAARAGVKPGDTVCVVGQVLQFYEGDLPDVKPGWQIKVRSPFNARSFNVIVVPFDDVTPGPIEAAA